MTRFQPVRVLKGNMQSGSNFSMRRVLIVAQFVVSQVLIISMVVIHTQMRYSENADLGFDKDAIVMIPIPNPDRMKMKTIKARFEQTPGVHEVSLCYEAPASQSAVFTGARLGGHTQDEMWEVSLKEADENFVSTFNMNIVAGRDLLPADTTREFLVNETMAKKLGFSSPEEILGKSLAVNGGTRHGTIEGVVQDFHSQSFHEVITPICIHIDYTRFRNVAVKIDLSQAQAAITSINRIWNETYPDLLFSYHFVDDTIAMFYESDNAVLRLVEAVALIAIIISCLGLYGLVSFMAVRKTKEIGVRKVLGASVRSILWLFGKEFALLIVVAFLAAAPLAWVAMDRWLQGFVYRIDISPATFALSIACTMIVATITVSYHSLRSALANPARSLRTE
jgi:ABC-type antimicrobial peptide transport system permease subunit